MSPGTEVQGIHGLFKSILTALIDPAMFTDKATRHIGIGVDPGMVDESLQLNLTGIVDPRLDHLALAELVHEAEQVGQGSPRMTAEALLSVLTH